MQNQLTDRVESKNPLTTTTPAGNQEKCLIACPIFRRELESVLVELNLVPNIHYMHYTIHNNPLIMEEELREGVEKAAAGGEEVRLLVGMHCKGKRDMAEVVDGCGGRIPQARNCIDILIGDELAKKLQKNRTSLMTPAWIRMINQSIAEGQWSITDARLNLGWYNKILILDTGVDPLSDEQIIEFYDLTQVEIDILPVTLDHFKSLLQDLLQ
ncbi:MAG: DUF1638 domain-containing protein [Thermodesulfobacteriota bacterium]